MLNKNKVNQSLVARCRRAAGTIAGKEIVLTDIPVQPQEKVRKALDPRIKGTIDRIRTQCEKRTEELRLRPSGQESRLHVIEASP